MAIDINTDERFSGGGTIVDSTSVLTQVAGFGGAILPTITSRYTYGTGNNQANKWALTRRTLAATTYDDLNLTSGLSALGAVQAFTAVKRVLVAIVDPDGTKKLRIGPQGRSNAALMWHQALTANFWTEVYTFLWMDRPVTGWPVTATTADIFPIYNPGGSSLEYALWILGTG